MDPDDHRRDVHPFDGEGLLRADEASKLLGESRKGTYVHTYMRTYIDR